ncbi:uncharacterized protein BCR38DRAFT_333345 [Pseudomassariella vexata]|uniref:SnoaL-like domain-containing protein n=1 Tax=Pseudomassariella vexata TaxID=1141098 RepID=A0A1Y2EE89_9PEZI|nr:uncharacterized protein BCR38DRAFT_333345 [Pseudomassariella vexata]ORY69634.1 hypothetical protein BCR38DRAFT_333345 [Pseudomassariella vexata]
MAATAQIQAATLEKFIAGWKKWTPEDMMAVWSDDCEQRMLPFSLGVPPRSRAEVKVILPKLIEVLTNFELEVYQVIHDAAKSKAVIYATTRADTPFGEFKCTNEYAVFVTFTEDGKQINRMEEMVDTAFYQEFFPKFQKYLSEQRASE